MLKNDETPLQHEAWREKLEEQATQQMFDRLFRAARSRLRTFAGPTGQVQKTDIDEIVASVLTDTLDGKLTWDPSQESLEDHLLDAVRFRVRNQWKREKHHVHEPIEEDDSDGAIAVQAAAGSVLPAAPASPSDLDRARRLQAAHDEVIAWLKPRVTDKPEVLRLLELYLQGVTERSDVLREGGMSEAIYHNARRRLGRLVQDMPAKLRAAALDALT